MLVVISPAKKLNMQPSEDIVPTQPIFGQEASELADVMQNLSLDKLQSLMGISENLAKLNADRFAHFGSQDKKPAALAFAGDTYLGLEAASLEANEMAWAQNHLRVLSGLYGVLRPLDAIEPYRLEMGTPLLNPRGKNLYQFWGASIAQYLNAQLDKDKTPVVINLASQEYFKAVDRKVLQARVIDCVFQDFKNGQYKIISFFAKRARGLMARYAIQHQVKTPEALQNFNLEAYAFEPSASNDDTLVFRRQLND